MWTGEREETPSHLQLLEFWYFTDCSQLKTKRLRRNVALFIVTCSYCKILCLHESIQFLAFYYIAFFFFYCYCLLYQCPLAAVTNTFPHLLQIICVCIAEDSYFKRLAFRFITHLNGMFRLVIKALRLTADLVLAVLHWLVDHHRCSSEVS